MRLRPFMRLLLALTYLLILWGAIVRRSGSGLGCPDWPLCYGQVVPPLEPAAWIEFTHRLIAGLVGILTIGIATITWIDRASRRSHGRLAAWIVALVVAQAVLGGITVKTELHPHIVAAHLGLGLLFFGSLLRFMAIAETPWRAGNAGEVPVPKSHGVGWLALIVVFAQIVVGGLVSGSQAGLACPDFPTCQGQWWPPFHGLVAIHMVHRLGALLVTMLIIAYIAADRPNTSLPVLLLLGLQIALGIGNVLLGLPFVVDVAHLAVGTALFGVLVVSLNRFQRASPWESTQRAWRA